MILIITIADEDWEYDRLFEVNKVSRKEVLDLIKRSTSLLLNPPEEIEGK